MKIVITGHTGLVGSKIVELFPNEEVIGLSRSNGYDLTTKYDECLSIMKSADIVFNNAYSGTIQANIIKDLKDSKVTLITIGSIAGYYSTNPYQVNKKIIHETYQYHKPFYPERCLLLIPGFLENNARCVELGRTVIDVNQVINGIKYFLDNKRVTMIEFDNTSRKL